MALNDPQALSSKSIGRIWASTRPVVAFVVSGGEDAFRADTNWPATVRTAVDACPPPRHTGYERPALIKCHVDTPTAAIGVDVPGRSFVELCTKPPLAFIQPSRNRLGTCGLKVRVEHLHCMPAQERAEQLLLVSRHPPSSSDWPVAMH
jgi:hypothetical protein